MLLQIIFSIIIPFVYSTATLVLVKPDAIGKTWSILDRLTNTTASSVIGIKIMEPSSQLVDEHYAEHVDKDFYPELRSFMLQQDSRIVVCVLCSQSVTFIEDIRALVGATNPRQATVGTIRCDFGCESVTRNCIHASDSQSSAQREIGIWFANESLLECMDTRNIKDEL
jgi:nucleoside-diphosphate kinase